MPAGAAAAAGESLLDHESLTVTGAGRTAALPLRVLGSLTRMGFLGDGGEPVVVSVAAGWTRLAGAYGSAYQHTVPGLALGAALDRADRLQHGQPDRSCRAGGCRRSPSGPLASRISPGGIGTGLGRGVQGTEQAARAAEGQAALRPGEPLQPGAAEAGVVVPQLQRPPVERQRRVRVLQLRLDGQVGPAVRHRQPGLRRRC